MRLRCSEKQQCFNSCSCCMSKVGHAFNRGSLGAHSSMIAVAKNMTWASIHWLWKLPPGSDTHHFYIFHWLKPEAHLGLQGSWELQLTMHPEEEKAEDLYNGMKITCSLIQERGIIALIGILTGNRGERTGHLGLSPFKDLSPLLWPLALRVDQQIWVPGGQ